MHKKKITERNLGHIWSSYEHTDSWIRLTRYDFLLVIYSH